jgi:transcriptional activator of cad operon
MERPTRTTLRIGSWCVNPASGEISRDGKTTRLDTRAMRLLLCLAERAGEVLSIEDLLNQVWSGVTVSPDSVYQAVASLRRVLGDDSRQPTYIARVPRLGYRMVATVTPWADEPAVQSVLPALSSQASENDLLLPAGSKALPPSRPVWTGSRSRFQWAAAAVFCLTLVAGFLLRGRNATKPPAPTEFALQSQRSIAVLPFLDLTEGMKEGEFADGMTEELIDKLSKISGLRVPPPTSSFFYKGKKIPIADIAKALGVAFVLDGSVRKSGVRLRVAARLIRTDTGYVVWSETYDRPSQDILMVQDDIAGQVTKALQASIA